MTSLSMTIKTKVKTLTVPGENRHLLTDRKLVLTINGQMTEGQLYIKGYEKEDFIGCHDGFHDNGHAGTARRPHRNHAIAAFRQ